MRLQDRKIFSLHIPHSLAKASRDLAEQDGSRLASLIRFLLAEAVRTGEYPSEIPRRNARGELLVTVSVAVSPDLADATKEILKRRGVSASSFVTALLRDWLAKRTEGSNGSGALHAVR